MTGPSLIGDPFELSDDTQVVYENGLLIIIVDHGDGYHTSRVALTEAEYMGLHNFIEMVVEARKVFDNEPPR